MRVCQFRHFGTGDSRAVPGVPGELHASGLGRAWMGSNS